MLTDAQIGSMSAAQRRELIHRLSRPPAEVLPSPTRLRRLRLARLLVTAGGSLVLVPWTFYLASILPGRYVVHGWPAVWVGFDLLLLVSLAATAWLGWRRRQAMILTAAASGVLILADAWFDVMTSSRGDVRLSVAMAVLIEVPVAALLLTASCRLVHATAVRFLVLPDSTRLWQIPMAVYETADAQAAARPR